MKNTVILFLIALFLNSCMSIAWIGYDKPLQDDYKEIDSVPIKIGMQNLKIEKQERAIREATKEVFLIFESVEFRTQVEAENWLVSCNIINGKSDIMDGKNVYEILSSGFVNFSINPRHPWNAVAQTQKSDSDHTKNRVAIKPKRIDAWSSDDIETKALLMNTIAHEITHTTSHKFSDGGHGTKNCPDEKLVSYGIGNLVAKMWIKKQ